MNMFLFHSKHVVYVSHLLPEFIGLKGYCNRGIVPVNKKQIEPTERLIPQLKEIHLP